MRPQPRALKRFEKLLAFHTLVARHGTEDRAQRSDPQISMGGHSKALV